MNKLQLIGLFSSCFVLNTAFAQECFTEIPASANELRFTINDDGTIFDKQTGLYWMRCNLGQTWENGICSGDALRLKWHEALANTGSFEFANKTNWRIPNIKEMSSIIEQQCTDPSINIRVFDKHISYPYWSSTPVMHPQSHAWSVNFQNGEVERVPKEWKRFTLLVHDG